MRDRFLNLSTFFSCIKISMMCMLFVVLSACAQFSPVLEKPGVSVENISLANNNFLSPRFNIALRVTNPNSIALPVVGMTYAINIEGVELFNGVKNDIPVISAYSDTVINVELGTNLLKAASLLSTLKDRQDTTVNYGLDAKIDLSGILPSFNVSEVGVLELPQTF